MIGLALHFARTSGRRAALALPLALLVSAIQTVGLLTLFPILAAAGITGASETAVSGWITDGFRALGLAPTLPAALSLFALAVAMREALMRAQTIFHAQLQQAFIRRLRSDLFEAVTYADWLHLCRAKPAVYLETLTGEISRVGAATQHLVRLSTSIIFLLGYLVAAMLVSPAMTGLAIASGAVLLASLKPSFRRAAGLGQWQTDINARLTGWVNDQLGGLRIIRVLSAQRRSLDQFDTQLAEFERLGTDTARNQANRNFGFNLAALLILCGLLFAGIAWLALPGASLMVLIVIFSRVMPQLSAIQIGYGFLRHLTPAYDSYLGLLGRAREHREAVDIAAAPAPEFTREISFAKVGFSYDPGTGPDVLKDFSMALPVGSATALVGASGAGKSTAADLLMGLLKPTSGAILVDGADLAQGDLAAWRRRVMYVPQDAFLFHDTVRANLIWARPDASDDALREVLATAGLDGVIARMPEGIDTVIGERGAGLSGGERQRLALARALLVEPSLLILDEATSALDAASEEHMQEVLGRLKGKVTLLVIAHRTSSLRLCDRIIRIEDGAARLVSEFD